MSFHDLLIDAIEVVLDRDIPDEAFADAVKAQACLMAGVGSD